MSDIGKSEPGQEEIELLLPWFVTGKLEADDKRMVEAYLLAHPTMRSQVALIEAEQSEVLTNNEAIGAPSAHALAKLMASIEREPTPSALLARLAGWVRAALDWFEDRSALVPVAAAAAVAILLQAVVIAALAWHGQAIAPGQATYQTASAPAATAPDKATYVIVGFAPAATVQQVEQALQPLGISVADGPKAGGIYRLLLSDKPLGETERDMLITALKSNSGVVRFVAPAGQ